MNVLSRYLCLVACLVPLRPLHAGSWEDWTFMAFDQAVLSHRMTKSSCLVILGAGAEGHLQDVDISTDRFLQQLEALHQPPDDVQPHQKWQTFQNDIDVTRNAADTMMRSARQIIAGDRHSIVVEFLLSHNAEVSGLFLKLAQASPHLMDDLGQSNALRRILLLRVQSQEVLRDLCHIRAGFIDKSAADSLPARLKQFDQNVDALINGDPTAEISSAPNLQIKFKLKAVQKRWQTLSQIVSSALETGEIETGDIQIASVMGDSVLTSLDQVVAFYGEL